MIRASKCFSLTVFSVLTLVACSSPKPIFYSSGKDAHILSCSGATWSGCLRDAGAICADKGYEILEKSSGREYGFFYDNTVKEMVISCGVSAPVITPVPVEEPKSSQTPSSSVKLGELGAAVAPEVLNKTPTKSAASATPQSATKPAANEPDASSLLIKQ
jgi:hypothetical protein